MPGAGWCGDDVGSARREGDADALPELPPQDADDPRGLPALRRAEGGRSSAAAAEDRAGRPLGSARRPLLLVALVRPGLALIILALVFVASDLLLLAGLLLLLVPVGMKLLGDAEQP